jgi:PAS domain S-box-containing protein
VTDDRRSGSVKPDGGHRVEARRPRGRRASTSSFEGVDLLETVERLGVPSYVVDRQGIIQWLNPAARGLAGAVAGRHFTDVVAPAYRSRARAQFLRKLHGEDATDFELEIVGAHGRRVLADVSSVAVRDQRRVIGVFGLLQPSRVRERAGPAPMLTPRQTEVLRLLAAGASTSQIQDTLHLARETVRNHVRHLLRALGAHSRLEAVAVARRRGLVD